MRYWRGYLTAAIIGLITAGLVFLGKRFSILVDSFYPFLTREIQTVLTEWSSTVDVVVWQVAAMLLVLGLLLSVVLMIALKWNFIQWLGWVLACVSLVWLLHTGVYGLNYYASPLSEDIHLTSNDFTLDDLVDTTVYFRDKANAMAQEMTRDENGGLIYSDFDTLAEAAGQGFHVLTYEQSGSVFAGPLEPVKQLAWADLYSSMGILGFTMPLTGEAAVNPQIPSVAMPFTMCHEMAHRMCIATEDDANFAAFLACLANEDPQFQYSAYYMAYRYCHQALLDLGTARATATAARIEQDVNAYLRYDLNVYDRFFADHHNELASSLADKTNDAYIKLSGDDAGTESYDRVAVDLVNWYLEVIVKPFMEQDAEPEFDPLDKEFIHGILGGQE